MGGGILGSRYEGVWRLEQGRNEGCLNTRGASVVPLETPEKPGGLTSPPGRRRAGAIVHSPLVEGHPGHQPPRTLQLLLYRAEQPPWGQRKPPPCPLQVGQMRHRCLRWVVFRELGSVPAAAGTVRWAKRIWAD